MARYVIFGAGAVGSILGAGLYRAGIDTILVGRAPHVQAIRKEGLQFKSGGIVHRIKLSAIDNLHQLKPKPDDRVLVTVKSGDTASAAEALSKVYKGDNPVVALQNAVCNEEILAQRFQSVYGGLVEFCGNFLRPGVVEHTRNNFLALGKFPRGFDALAESMATDLSAAGFRVECCEQVMAVKWWKLILNLGNSLLAILDCWLQKAQVDPEVYPLMADVMDEGLEVLWKAGIEPRSPEGVPAIDVMIQKLRRGDLGRDYDLSSEARTYPSTWQDLTLQRGKTEASFLNGEIERLGQRHGVPTPRNSALLRLVEEMAARRELPGKYSPAEMQTILDVTKS